MSDEAVRLLVGLGNPGQEYSNTRHNAGFWWLDQVAEHNNITLLFDQKWRGRVAKTMLSKQPVWLFEPQTFMNTSGRAVAALADFYKLKPAQILVAHDELDLAVGHIKLKYGGGHAGHNGVRNTIDSLGSGDFWRLRIGIGHPGERNKVTEFVLSAPNEAERANIDNAIQQTLTLIPLLLCGDFNQACQQLHHKTPLTSRP